MVNLYLGDCIEVLRNIADNSVDAIVTDPPYGLSFMGKRWDYDVPSEDVWRECLRVLKPGGHLLAFAGTRTQHRMAVRIEDAGFEIRDMIAWVYGSGFPKSLDVSKAIDKAAGAERERYSRPAFGGTFSDDGGSTYGTAICDDPATDAARQWHGWGTALKPALEPITVARKPLIGTVAENVLTWGTGGVNVDGCRVDIDPVADASQLRTMNRSKKSDVSGWGMNQNGSDTPTVVSANGRWPANLIHDGSEEVVGLFPDTGKSTGGRTVKRSGGGNVGSGKASESVWSNDDPGYGDSGSAARFFYCAKASKRDRDEGCEGMEAKLKLTQMRGSNGTGDKNFVGGFNDTVRHNHHPTVKPTDLMRYLCRLVTPPGGTVLDPFMGSGSTGKAAVLEGFNFIGIEREAEYLDIANARINAVLVDAEEDQPTLFDGIKP